MRRIVATVVVIAALNGTGQAAAGPTFEGERWRPDVRAAREYAAHRLGAVSFAVRTPRHLYGDDVDRAVPSASVVKAMLMIAYLNHPDVRRRRLTAADHALLGPMIRTSDNIAATRVRDFVGTEALARLARRVGMTHFATSPIWGLCQITARDQTRLFLGPGRYVVELHRRYAMRLLGSIAPSQRWGVGRARPRSWALYFKSGWGDGSGAVDHQAALLRRGRRRVAVAILTTGNPSHPYGKATLRGVARRLLSGLRPRSMPR